MKNACPTPSRIGNEALERQRCGGEEYGVFLQNKASCKNLGMLGSYTWRSSRPPQGFTNFVCWEIDSLEEFLGLCIRSRGSYGRQR